jgi:hypothetical protein
VHEQFAHDHVRAFAAERMHAQARLDVIKAEFDLPALLIPGGDMHGAVGVDVAQCGDDLQLLRGKPGLVLRTLTSRRSSVAGNATCMALCMAAKRPCEAFNGRLQVTCQSLPPRRLPFSTCGSRA